MKKIISLLFVAMLALSAWADVTVTFIPGTTVGNNMSANAYDEMSLDGVTISCTAGAFAQNPYRFGGGGSTSTFSSTVGNIKKVEFTCQGSFGQTYGPDFYGDGYTAHSGSNIGVWQGDAASFTLNAASQVRVNKIVVTIAEDVVTELVAPEFHPNGGEFSGSLEVTLTCPTENAQIWYWEGTEDEQGEWHYYNQPFYVTETKTFTAVSMKGNDMSEYVTVTFTKVEQTVEAPVFTPASCTFTDRLDVTLACATPNASIYYSLDNEMWSEYTGAIPVTDDLTIWAKAKVGDVESEVVSATYTKLAGTTASVTFDASVDTGDGSTTRSHFTIVKDGVTMYCGDGTVYPDMYRMYASDSACLKFTSVDPIIKIEFEGVSGNPASNIKLAEGYDGTFTTSNPDGVWEGVANEVLFDVTRQARFYSITVTTLSTPVDPQYPLGDVNHDYNVNIADVTALIDALLSSAVDIPAEANMNGDDAINIADVTALIDYLLSGTIAE